MTWDQKKDVVQVERGPEPGGPGPCQPPRNVAVAIPANTIMCRYSAMKNEPKRMPPNSVL